MISGGKATTCRKTLTSGSDFSVFSFAGKLWMKMKLNVLHVSTSGPLMGQSLLTRLQLADLLRFRRNKPRTVFFFFLKVCNKKNVEVSSSYSCPIVLLYIHVHIGVMSVANLKQYCSFPNFILCAQAPERAKQLRPPMMCSHSSRQMLSCARPVLR